MPSPDDLLPPGDLPDVPTAVVPTNAVDRLHMVTCGFCGSQNTAAGDLARMGAAAKKFRAALEDKDQHDRLVERLEKKIVELEARVTQLTTKKGFFD